MITLTDLRDVLRQTHCWPLPLPSDVSLYLFDHSRATGLTITDDATPPWLVELSHQALTTHQLVQAASPEPAAAHSVEVDGQIIGVLALIGTPAALLASPLAASLALLASKEEELEEHTGRIQDTYEQILFLLAISKMVTSSAPRRTLLQTGLKEGVELLRVQGGMVLPADAHQEAVVLGVNWATELRADITEALRRHEGVVLCNSRAQCDQFCPALNGRVESLAAAEVWLHGEPELGLLLFNKQTPLGFLAADRQMVSFVAEQLQTVLRRDHLLATQATQQRLNREIELAGEIYQTLVPQNLPQQPALDLAVISRPAREMGGDFYVVDQLPGGDLMLIVGDVAGKGLPAALVMSQTLATLRAVAYSSTSGPAQILVRSQALLERMLDTTELFVTVFLGQFNPTSGRLRYADAGHGHAQYRNATNATVQGLPATGTPLGALFWDGLDERELILAPGDQLLIVSDGVIEMPSAQSELFGKERLSGFFGLIGRDTSQKTLARIDQALGTFANSGTKAALPAHDDVTALLVQRHPSHDMSCTCDHYATVYCFDAQLEAITPFTQWLHGVTLAIDEWDETVRFTCVLAAVECFTNIVRHAYTTHTGNVQATAILSDTHLEVELRDTGAPMLQPALVFADPEEPDPELLAEGGYGLYIMRTVVDQLDYRSDAKGNMWRLSYRRATEEQHP